MAFTLDLPGGVCDFDYEVYVGQLDKRGINIVNTLRVVGR
jgi:hypothetical protein